MKAKLIVLLVLIFPIFLFAQSLQKAPIKINELPSGTEGTYVKVPGTPRTNANYSAIDHMPNVYGPAIGALNPAAYDGLSNTAIFVHRGATIGQGFYAQGSGELWYNYSTDMGVTWHRSVDGVNSSNTQILARYPSAALLTNTTNPTIENLIAAFAWPELDQSNGGFQHIGYAADLSLDGTDIAGITDDGNPTSTPWYSSQGPVWSHRASNGTGYIFWASDNQDDASIRLWRTTDYSDITVIDPPTWNSAAFGDNGNVTLGGVADNGIVYYGVLASFAEGFVGPGGWGVGYSKSIDNGNNWSAWNTVDWTIIPATSQYTELWDYKKYDGFISYQGDINVDKNGHIHIVTGLTKSDTANGSELGENAIVEFFETSSGWDAKIIESGELLADSTFTQYEGVALGQMGPSVYLAFDENREFMVAQWVTHDGEYPYFCDVYMSYRALDGGEWSEPMNLTGTHNENENSTHLAPMLAKVGDTYKAFSFYFYPDDFTGGFNPPLTDPTVIYGATVDVLGGPVLGWSVPISIHDAVTKTEGVVTIGLHPDATDGIDAVLGEEELPPVPPAGAFDIRCILPVNLTPASLKDYRNSENDAATWKVRFQPGTSYPITLSWNSSQLPSGTFRLVDELSGAIVNLNMKEVSEYTVTNTALNTLLIEYSEEIDVDVNVNSGWNLVSVPVLAEDMSVSSLFENATSSAFTFNNGYVSVNELMLGEGYWLKFGNSEDVTITGMPTVENISVNQGWNLVGPFSYEINTSAISTNPAGILGGNFFGYNAGYFTASSLLPGKGYWVKTSASGELILNMTSKRGDDVESVNEAPMYTIDIATNDGASGSYALALGIDTMATDGIYSDLGETELPPLPPAGVYDARLILGDNTTGTPKDYRAGDNNFTGQVTYKMNVQYGDGATALTLDVNIPQVPGTVTVTVKDVVLNGGIVNEVLNEGVGQVVVTNMNVNSLYVIVDYNAPIPVELTSFAANVVGETIQLAWETATETNNKGFEVERSSDKETFTQIGKIDGHGTTAEKQSYNFTDHNATSGTYYYRLRQVDFDGTSTYSDVVEVEFIPTEYSLGQNYPNPFNPSTKVKFAVPVESKVTVTLYNMLGQKVKELVAAQYNVGLHEVELNASDLASGMYIYSITAQGVDGSNFVDTKKMMLMK